MTYPSIELSKEPKYLQDEYNRVFELKLKEGYFPNWCTEKARQAMEELRQKRINDLPDLHSGSKIMISGIGECTYCGD